MLQMVAIPSARFMLPDFSWFVIMSGKIPGLLYIAGI
jgi:hypothetical protein